MRFLYAFPKASACGCGVQRVYDTDHLAHLMIFCPGCGYCYCIEESRAWWGRPQDLPQYPYPEQSAYVNVRGYRHFYIPKSNLP